MVDATGRRVTNRPPIEIGDDVAMPFEEAHDLEPIADVTEEIT
jgi:hypothetical protein